MTEAHIVCEHATSCLELLRGSGSRQARGQTRDLLIASPIDVRIKLPSYANSQNSLQSKGMLTIYQYFCTTVCLSVNLLHAMNEVAVPGLGCT